MHEEIDHLGRAVGARPPVAPRFSRPRGSARRVGGVGNDVGWPARSPQTPGRRAACSGPACRAAHATDSLDPALDEPGPVFLRPAVGRTPRRRCRRKAMSKPALAEEMGRLRRRQDLDLQDPQGRPVPQWQGVTAEPTWWRPWSATPTRIPSPARSASWAASSRSRPTARNVVFTLKDAERRPALPARRLPSGDPAERRQGQPDRRHRHRPLQGHRQRARRAPWRREIRQLLARRHAALPTRSRSSSSTMRRRAPRPAGRPGRT